MTRRRPEGFAIRKPALHGSPDVDSNCKEESVILCDFCGQSKECLQKEIDGREFDICADCWRPLEEKLKGKGRVKRKREVVLLPPTAPETHPDQPKPAPGTPPKIWGSARALN